MYIYIYIYILHYAYYILIYGSTHKHTHMQKIMTHLKKIKQDEVPMGGNIFTDKGKAAPVVITPQKVVTQCVSSTSLASL